MKLKRTLVFKKDGKESKGIQIGDDGFVMKESMKLFLKKRKDKNRPYLVGDEKSFGEAFAIAREKVGNSGTFIYKGKEYNTKMKKEQ